MTLNQRFLRFGLISIFLIATLTILELNFISQSDKATATIKTSILIGKKITNLILLTNNYILHSLTRQEEQWFTEYKNLISILEENKSGSFSDILTDLIMLHDYYQRYITENESDSDDIQSDSLKILLIEKMTFNSEHILTEAFTLIENAEKTIDNTNKVRTLIIVIVIMLIFVINLFGFAMIIKRISTPLKELQTGIKRIRNDGYTGDITYIDNSHIPTEFIEFTESFNSMTHKLAHTSETLKKEIEIRKKTELKLNKSLNEKEILLQELYHRTKNNMHVIYSMMMLSAKKYSNKDVNELVRGTGSRIQAMSLVHQKLYQSKDLSYINVREYFKELVDLLIQTYNTSSVKISLVLDIEDISMLIDTAIPFGLVLNELMSNTLKYAFPNGQPGEIKIKLNTIEPEGFKFTYSDNGIGVPEDFDFKNQTTLGFKMITGIAGDQMEGIVDFISSKGLKCHITFPKILYKARI